jgi:hypothetical protein
MRKIIIAIALLVSSPALAGWCNQIGQVTQCFNDRGDMTTINQVGSMYLTEETDKKGRTKSESYQFYDNNQPSSAE